MKDANSPIGLCMIWYVWCIQVAVAQALYKEGFLVIRDEATRSTHPQGHRAGDDGDDDGEGVEDDDNDIF